MKDKIYSRITVRLFSDNKCFGPGIATLLTFVKECNSLRAAASSMNMAYSKAFSIVKSCEEQLGFKLLDSTTGGRHGGGASLTKDAEKLLESYNEYCKQLNTAAEQLFNEKLGYLNN